MRRGGFGFIRPDSGSDPEIFVWDRDLPDKAREGTRVSFDIVKGDEGPNAANISKDMKMAPDPERANIVQAFNGAIAILDQSENEIRCMIENDLMDVAGFNRMKVGDAMLARDALSKKIAAVRERYVKNAFQFLRDNIPNDEIQKGIAALEKAEHEHEAQANATTG